MNDFPILQTKRLHLNEVTMDDATFIFEMFADPAVTQFYDFEVFANEQQAVDLIKNDGQKIQDKQMLRWAVREKSTGQFLGGCGINRYAPANHVAVISYEFCQAAWGKGYGTEALRAMIAYAFSDQCQYNINRIEADTMLRNEASENLLTKLGFVYEGTMRQYGYWKNAYHDLKLFGLLREDCNY
jgi:ribosomal-protein-alanine N-acetyltransferase